MPVHYSGCEANMIYTPKSLNSGTALTGSLVTQYTAPATVVCTIVKEVIICNTDPLAQTVTLHIIPPAGSAAVGNTIFSGVTLQPGETSVVALSRVMAPSGFIQALASKAAVIGCAISGIEVTV